MPRAYETPGVYFERTDASSSRIPGLRTDIAGFIGIAESGPRHTPIPIESWRQFEGYFGEFTSTGYLAYAVRAFFDNGGRRCWVVRVTSDAASTAGVELGASAGSQATWLRIEAISPGVWGEELEVTLQETHRAQTRTLPMPTLSNEAVVEVTAGFGPRVLTRLSQEGLPPIHHVIRAADADNLRLIWEAPLVGFDPAKPISVESVEYSVFVKRSGRLLRVYEGLSLVAGHPRFGPDILPSFAGLLRRRRTGIPTAPEPIAIIASDTAGTSSVEPLDLSNLQNVGGGQYLCVFRGGGDGLSALRPWDYMGEEPATDDDDQSRLYKLRGIAALNTIDEVAIVAIPDIHIRPRPAPPKAPAPVCVPDPCLTATQSPSLALPPSAIEDMPPTFSDEQIFAVQSHLVEQCERMRDRFAVLDPPYSAARNDKLGTTAIRRWRNRFDSSYAAVYYPWLAVVDPLRLSQSLVREIPPSGHVAGVMARGDIEVGVHRAPANVGLAWAEEVTADLNDAEHGLLNLSGINALRALAGRGIRIFGARTLSSDPDWRFINVRRLLMMIEEAVDEGLQWVVFEPNDHITRTKVTLVIRSLLTSVWEKGGLIGPTPDDAFFVKCSDVNNPPSERGNGRLLAEVGVAASQPFEFVVLRVGRVNNALEIDEAGIVGVPR